MAFKLTNFDLAENIFFFHNCEIEPLVFVLDSDTEDNFYFNILNRFFAEVVNEPNEHSMVLAHPKNSTYFHRHIPAFDVKYIDDCFNLKDLPDPTKYFIQNSCPLKYSKEDIFDRWFHKKKTWFDLISVQEIDDDHQSGFNQIKPFTHENINHIVNPKSRKEREDSDDDLTLNNSRFYARSVSSNKNRLNTSSSSMIDLRSTRSSNSNKKTRLPYSYKEDVAIVQYILKHNYAFDITGRKMWQMMERSKVGKIRTWQSLKERYIKHIRYELISGSYKFPFLTPEDLKLLRQGLNLDPMKDHKKKKMKLEFQEQRNAEGFSDESS